MKQLVIIILIGMLYANVTAQTNIFPSSGNVGVGTVSPQTNLHIPSDGLTIGQTNLTNAFLLIGSINKGIGFDDNEIFKKGGDLIFGTGGAYNLKLRTNSTDALTIDRDGKIGIGTESPNVRLHVDGKLCLGNFSNVSPGKLLIKGDGANEGLTVWNESGATTLRLWADASRKVGFLTRGNDELRGIALAENGFVGIGTSTPTSRFQVNGTIKATEIKVEAQTADFVFEDEYQLKDLVEVETFIKINKHLPEIPSAAKMDEIGINLAEMNQLLLMKIEELTLYTIEQEKKIKVLTAKSNLVIEQEERLRKLEKIIQQKGL